jgi:hypothetical protein
MDTPSATARNVRAICELEAEALAQRTVSARIGDAIATHAALNDVCAGDVYFFVGRFGASHAAAMAGDLRRRHDGLRWYCAYRRE